VLIYKEEDNMMRKMKFSKRIVATVMAIALAGSINIMPGASHETFAADTLPERVGEEDCKEIPGTESTFSRYNNSFLSVSGFASAGVHDRSEYVGTEYYRQVKTPAELVQAVSDAQKKNGAKVKVIEIMRDLDVGYGEAGVDNMYMDTSKQTCMFLKDEMNAGVSIINPLLSAAGGVSKIQIKDTDGLTIFSRYGATLNHTEFDIQATSNDVVIRNIKMDGSWQWDNNDKKLQKESGITYVKINGTNVWIDHCEFTIAPDGCIDLETGSNGVTLSWCKIGMDPDEAVNNEMIRATILNMEKLYQEDLADIAAGSQPAGTFTHCDINSGSRYRQMREAGATPEEIMMYTAYHSKVHLVGSGDKDIKVNPNHRITLAYNSYESVGQRIPMIRQGTGHLFNCVIDNTKHIALEDKFQKEYKLSSSVTGYTLTRCINARNGASIAADTCVFKAVNGAITGKECQGDDTGNVSGTWVTNFSNTYNRSLIVNSKVTRTDGTSYTGSSWDKKGDNAFVEGGKNFWHDKENPVTYKNWAWSSTVKTTFTGETYPGVFDVEYNTDEKLPYKYQMVPLEDVEKVVTTYSGMGVYDLTPEQWLKTEYDADSDIEPAGENKVYIAKSVDFADDELVTYVGDKITFRVVTSPENVTNPTYKWSVKNGTSGKATIDENTGELTAVAKGKVKVTVKVTSLNGLTVSKTAEVNIKDASQKPAEPENPTGPGGDVENPTGPGGDVENPTGPGGDVENPTGGSGDVENPTGGSGDVENPTGGSGDVENPTGGSGDVENPTGPGEDVENPTGPGGDVENPTGPGGDVENPTGPGGNVEKPTDDDKFKAGDADCNGKVDLNDAKIILKISLGIDVKVSEEGEKNADYDKSGKIDLNDAKYVLKEALGIKVNLPNK